MIEVLTPKKIIDRIKQYGLSLSVDTGGRHINTTEKQRYVTPDIFYKTVIAVEQRVGYKLFEQ
jgi:hypothetical protein